MAIHLLWTSLLPNPIWIREHILYNSIWIIALIICIQSPLGIDRIAVVTIALAIFMWGSGSFLASVAEFQDTDSYFNLIAQISYALFYPLILISIPRIAGKSSKVTPVEALDAVIFGLGFTSITAALLLASVFKDSFIQSSDQFFLIFYPVGDIGLLLSALFLLVRHGLRKQSLLLITGISIFAATDISYLYLVVHARYTFGSIVDLGWLCGVTLLALSLHQPSSEARNINNIHPALIALSIFMSPVLLALGALKPGLFPVYVVIPSVAKAIPSNNSSKASNGNRLETATETVI